MVDQKGSFFLPMKSSKTSTKPWIVDVSGMGNTQDCWMLELKGILGILISKRETQWQLVLSPRPLALCLRISTSPLAVSVASQAHSLWAADHWQVCPEPPAWTVQAWRAWLPRLLAPPYSFLLLPLQLGFPWQHFAPPDNHLDVTTDSSKVILHSVEQNASVIAKPWLRTRK